MQQVLELAHVAGKRVLRQVLQRLRRQRWGGPDAGVARDALEELLGDAGQITQSLSQRGHANLDHVEPVIQILSEPPGLHLGRQILVGGTEQPHVRRHLADRPHGSDRALLHRAQQLRLHRQGQIANLVQKQGAAIGRLEESFAVLVGAGERTAPIAEELGLEQVFRNRSAVDRNERMHAA